MLFPQFIMRINFHFSNKKNPAEGDFVVGEDLKRKVPLEIEGINRLNSNSSYGLNDAIIHITSL